MRIHSRTDAHTTWAICDTHIAINRAALRQAESIVPANDIEAAERRSVILTHEREIARLRNLREQCISWLAGEVA